MIPHFAESPSTLFRYDYSAAKAPQAAGPRVSPAPALAGAVYGHFPSLLDEDSLHMSSSSENMSTLLGGLLET